MQVLSCPATPIIFEYIQVHEISPENTDSLVYASSYMSYLKSLVQRSKMQRKLLGTGAGGKMAVDAFARQDCSGHLFL